MNERIKELADQARKALAVDAMGGGEFNMKAYEEKFAELIVRECIKKYNEYGIYSSDQRSFIIAGHNLERHFDLDRHD